MTNLYKNENYAVVLTEAPTARELDGDVYTTYYSVQNHKTGVVESRFTVLPEAIHAAASWNHMLESKAWEWLTKKEESPDPRAH